MVEVPERKGKHPPTQIVFVDTPGIHRPASQLDRSMMHEIHEALMTRDVVLLVVDAVRRQSKTAEAPLKLDRNQRRGARLRDDPQTRLPGFSGRDENRSGAAGQAFAADRRPERAALLCGGHSGFRPKKGDGLKLLLHKIAEYLPGRKRWFA